MTDKTIGDLTAAGALDGTELVHIVQGGNSRRATLNDIAALSGGGGLSVPLIADFSITLNAPAGTNQADALQMTGAADNDLLRGYLNLIPAGNFSVVIKAEIFSRGNFNGFGIAFRDTAGKYVVCGPIHVGGPYAEIGQWSSQTAFAGGVVPYAFGVAAWPEWYKADFDASTNDVTFSISRNGVDWISLGTSTYLATCDAVGIVTVFRNSTLAPTAWFKHYEIV
jgi:hypothetical protein